MAAYIGHTVTLEVKNEGGRFCGRLLSHDHVDGKIVLTKVTCLTTGKRLPGNQIYFDEEIIANSFWITDEVTNEKIKMGNKALKEKKSLSVEQRGAKRENPHLPLRSDLQRETFQLASFYNYMQKQDDPSKLPSNIVTANQYQQKYELVPREQWTEASKVIRPTTFIVVDQLGAMFDEAIHRINMEQSIGVAFTGINISRDGKLCWIQVATFDMVYLFDAFIMGHSCISYGLDKIFSSPTILKVTHDCRWISDLLFHQYNIKILNVFDTQVAAVLSYRTMNGGDLPAYVKSLQTLVEEYLPIEQDEYHVFKIRQPFRDAEEQLWSTRPLHRFLLDSLAKTVSYLNELREPLLKEMMRDFYIAMDSYVSIIKDQTRENMTNKPQPERHLLPSVFKNLQQSHIHRSRSARYRDEPNVVYPEGFIETLVKPTDREYRRDSINHSEQESLNHIKLLKSKAPSTESVPRAKAVNAHRYIVPSHIRKELPASSKLPVNACKDLPSAHRSNPSSSSSSTRIHSSGSNTKTSSPDKTQKSSIQKSSTDNTETSKTTTLSQDWQPFPKTDFPSQLSDEPILMMGVNSNSKRSAVVGRGRPLPLNDAGLTSGHAATYSMLRQGSGDSDSGVDSGPVLRQPEHIINRVGLSAGFQNFEMMGSAPISLEGIPQGFDIKSASVRELRMLQQGQIKCNMQQEERTSKRHIPVVRQVINKDGSITDLDSGLKYSGGSTVNPLVDLPQSNQCDGRTGSIQDDTVIANNHILQKGEEITLPTNDFEGHHCDSDSDIQWDD